MCKKKKSAANNSRTRVEKSKVQKQFSKAHKEVRSIRTDKRNFAEDLARRTQEAARMRHLKALLHYAIFLATCLAMVENLALQVAEIRC